VPVASPHTITGLAKCVKGAYHTIFLRAVDQDGNVDPSPAWWGFEVFNDRKDKDNCKPFYNDYDNNGRGYYHYDDIVVKKVEDDLTVKEVEDDVNVKEVKDDLEIKGVEDDVKEVEDDLNIKEADDVILKKVEGDVIIHAVEDGKKTKQILENIEDILGDTKKIVNELDDESDEIKKVVNERADDIEKQISDLNDDGKLFKKISDQLKTLRNGQKDSKEDILDRLDKLEADLQRAIDLNEKALKEKIEDSEGDVKAKVEDSEDDIIKAISKQINALWDWLRDLVAELSKALGVAAKEEK
jgi:gas vesicle protein